QQQNLQSDRNQPELLQLLHQISDKNRVMIRRSEIVRCSQRIANRLLYDHVIAGIVQPDAVQIFQVLDVSHRIERHINLTVDIAVAFLHLWFQYADDRKADTVQPDALPNRVFTREELRFSLRSNNRDVAALLIIEIVKESAGINIKLENV